MYKNEKLLTISIAAYNAEAFIEKTISSCINEEIKNLIEILVIDDGSTDETANIADQVAKQYPDTVRVIRKENGGYGSTINTSIPLARGKYFKLLDADDWYIIDGLCSLLNDLQMADAEMFLNPYISFFEKNGETKLNDALPDVETGIHSINDNIDFSKSLRMHHITFKTEILRDMHRNITEHCVYTDIEFISYPLSRVNRVYISHVPVYCYRIGRDEQTMSVAGIRKHISDHEIVFKNLFNLYNDIENKNMGYAKVLYKLLERECIGHYQYLFLLEPSKTNKKKLKELDEKLKEYPVLYRELAEQRKMISYFRKTRFLAYRFICRTEMRKKKQANW